MQVMGSGDYRYEVTEEWAKLPQGWRFGVTTGVTIDSAGRVYICQQQQDPPVVVFDTDGSYLSSWGSGLIVEPHTLYIAQDDIVYLADRGAHVALKLTLEGTPLMELGTRGHPSDTGCTEDEGEVLRAAGPFNKPTRLFPSPSGDLYASDGYRNSRVHRFSADGALAQSWGTPGGAVGEIRVPHAVWVDKQGLVYVCDRSNNRIQVFSATGDPVDQWNDVIGATDLVIDSAGTVYVHERQGDDNWMSVRDLKGTLKAQWGAPRSHQICVDPRGDIYMAVSQEGRIAKGVRVR